MKLSFRTIVLAALLVLQVAIQQGWIGKGVIPGPRDVTIYYETANKTPAFNQMIVSMRSGPNAEYLTARGTDLEILDVTSNPQPDASLVLPALYVEAGDSVIYKTTITDVSPAAVMEEIKANGG